MYLPVAVTGIFGQSPVSCLPVACYKLSSYASILDALVLEKGPCVIACSMTDCFCTVVPMSGMHVGKAPCPMEPVHNSV